MDSILLNKIARAYETHGSLIVGVDFDDTIFPFTEDEENVKRCVRVKSLLRELKKTIENKGGKCIICLYTVANSQSLKYKEEIMYLYGLKPDYINESPLDKNWGNPKKPFFNILLDDKTGLNDTIETLTKFLKTI